jgi:hypothetical protein
MQSITELGNRVTQYGVKGCYSTLKDRSARLSHGSGHISAIAKGKAGDTFSIVPSSSVDLN